MAMREKTGIAAELGCMSAWRQHGHIRELFTDNGSAFSSDAFRYACADVGIGLSLGVAGVPHLRGHIERFFGTLSTGLMPLLSGRVFSNPVERGGYPAEAQACLSEDDIIEVISVFILDAYHNRKHRGLNWATPNQAWEQLCLEHGTVPPVGKHKIRSAMRISFTRKSGRHGIRFASLHYHSSVLASRFMERGAEQLELRIDPDDVSQLSCRFGGEWHTLSCTTPGFDGLSFETWRNAMLELRQNNGGHDALSRKLVAGAVTRIRERNALARARRGLSSEKLTSEVIEQAEEQVFWGVHIANAAEPHQDASLPDGLDGLRGERIAPVAYVEDQSCSEAPGPMRVWRFSDDES